MLSRAHADHWYWNNFTLVLLCRHAHCTVKQGWRYGFHKHKYHWTAIPSLFGKKLKLRMWDFRISLCLSLCSLDVGNLAGQRIVQYGSLLLSPVTAMAQTRLRVFPTNSNYALLRVHFLVIQIRVCNEPWMMRMKMEISDALRQDVRALLRGSISYRYSGGKEQDTRVRVTFTDDFLC